MTTKENLTKIGRHLGFTVDELTMHLSNVTNENINAINCNENINAINYVLSKFADKLGGAGAAADGRRRSKRRSKRKSKSRRKSKRKY